MLVLAIDTSTATVVSGVVADGRTIGETILPDCRDHNEQLVVATQRALEQAGKTFQDVDAVVVGAGPGPFTGLRVGMATGAAFADALGIPVYGVCSLDAIAAQIPGTALVTSDARRREVYWATYQDGVRTSEPEVNAYADVNTEGFDAVNVPQNLQDKIAGTHDLYPTPAALVSLVDFAVEPTKLTPLYLRRPDAKEPAARPKSPAIPDVAL
ncbi:tRNA (adenosine(37)-N6)-threonylcarbamoyltransferase complex dimerization subunit type 1 TsaB [Corynebacterium kalinowskii]|uniref:tRNA (adenosine(37)-N6)-threonylcarbamoyltransferase complex dimerization subunit type 1 TsaB n=1 Tax=Corynebacterium kalinowskii TaxID=2675216 RepID=UPI0012E1B81A|nr:tRNA (adenosine(37)-N6)-threonylcarbamoyltransferase complex dimerization subunit type 1 TsaB [Corynebacterium kalinowskii]